MALKMLKEGCQVHVHHMNDYIHAFSGISAVKEYSRGNGIVLNILRELLELPEVE